MNERRAFYFSLAVALITFWLVHFVSFRGSVPHFLQLTGGAPLFDTSIPRSASELYERLEKFGEEGRSEYVFRNFTTDVALPFSLLPVLLLGTRRLGRRFALKSTQRWLFALPIAYVVLDLIENMMVVTLIANFPSRYDLLPKILPIFTMIKRAAIATSLLALLLGLLASAALKVWAFTFQRPRKSTY